MFQKGKIMKEEVKDTSYYVVETLKDKKDYCKKRLGQCCEIREKYLKLNDLEQVMYYNGKIDTLKGIIDMLNTSIEIWED